MFVAVDFVSLYIEIPIMIVMFIAWTITRRVLKQREPTNATSLSTAAKILFALDIVDVDTVDLDKDEYNVVEEEDVVDDEKREGRTGKGKLPLRLLWRLYYWIV